MLYLDGTASRAGVLYNVPEDAKVFPEHTKGFGFIPEADFVNVGLDITILGGRSPLDNLD
jgi:hypothetical protein